MLDNKGLVALWREGLLARKVLEGKTKGYKKHPQLERFKNSPNSVMLINSYLYFVFIEAEKRGFCFDKSKLYDVTAVRKAIPVTRGQMEFELKHLASKIRKRTPEFAKVLCKKKLRCNPVFFVVEGPVENWEKIDFHKF